MDDRRTAVLLAGGLGSRLRPYTLTIPKPLLPVGGRPIIEIVILQLAAHGFERIVVSVGYLGELIRAYLDDGARLGVQVEYVSEPEPLGTAGPLTLIQSLPEKFLVMNGDILSTLDYGQFLESLGDAEAAISTTVRTVDVDYGVLHADGDGVLTEYEEKPTLRYAVSMGVYALTRPVVSRIPEGRYDMPDLFRAISADGGRVRCVQTDSYWRDVGRVDDFEAANVDLENHPERFVPQVRERGS